MTTGRTRDTKQDEEAVVEIVAVETPPRRGYVFGHMSIEPLPGGGYEELAVYIPAASPGSKLLR